MCISVRIHETIHQVVWQHFGITRIFNLHTPQHLANNNLDMLIVDIHTSVTVNALHLFDQVGLNRFTSLDPQHILRITLPRSHRRSSLNPLTIRYHNITCSRYRIRTLVALLETDRKQAIRINDDITFRTCDNRHRLTPLFSWHQSNDLIFLYTVVIADQHLTTIRQWILIKEYIGRNNTYRTYVCAFVFYDLDDAIDFSNLCLVFWYTSLKEFFNTWQALGDVSLGTSDTSSVESTHG